jgi:hypothetical protein
MTGTMIEDLQRSLSDVFFRRELNDFKLELQKQEKEAADRLGAATGIGDEELLAQLSNMGIRVETLAALTLIPLIQVAWVDGLMDDRERQSVLAGAESTGIAADSPSYHLLRFWLEDRPPDELYKAWYGFIRTTCEELDEGERARFSENILARAHAVGAAAGETLSAGPGVSRLEEELLGRLKAAFDA